MAQSRSYKKVMNFVYGMGAAVVIVGALFKIQHISLDLGIFESSGPRLQFKELFGIGLNYSF